MNFSKKVLYYYTLVCTNFLWVVVSTNGDKFWPIVTTKLGKIQGRVLKSDYGADYLAFQSIPYAKPPIKDLRFRAPQAADKWDDILNATEDGPWCIQFDIFRDQFTGDEDCLYLNVYSPKLNESLPVLFFIHGGGFFCGTGMSSLYGAQRFMDKEVVLVTVNYRLGPLGFLSTGDEASPGNYGMLDQVLALRWVQDNIAAFGGDKNRVTIFGESAGGASVTLHMLSPLSKGLFHGAIPQSGAAAAEWATLDNLQIVQERTKELAKSLKCPTDYTKNLVECLRNRAALDIIVNYATVSMGRIKVGDGFLRFIPVVDKAINGDNSFLPKQPIALLTENKFNAVPTMTGITKDEWLTMLSMLSEGYNGIRGIRKEDTLKILKSFAPHLLENTEREQRVIETLNEYLKPVNESNLKEKVIAISRIIDDFFMEYPADETAALLAKHTVPTFVYKLTYRGKYTAVQKLTKEQEILNRDWQLVAHMDDLQYLFHCNYFVSADLSDEDKKMADIMLTLWTNFAKTGVPSLEGSKSNYPGFEWLPTTTEHTRYLDLSLKPKMVNGHLCERYDIWKKLYATFGDKDEL